MVRDTAYTVDSYHDFPVHHPIHQWWEPYPDFKDKLDRRIRRFLAAVDSAPVCLVRTQTSKEEARDLIAAANGLSRRPCRLLVVNMRRDGANEVKYEDWDLSGACAVSVPPGRGWQGYDPAWDEIMEGFRLA